MREDPGKGSLFDDLRNFLQRIAGFDENEAAIYALGIERGVITTRDAMGATKLRQTTAGEILRRLSKRGFFRASISEAGGKGGRGHAQRFAVENPKTALKIVLESIDRFQDLLGQIDEHLEVIGSQGSVDEEMWELSPDTLVSQFVASVGSCSSSVKVVSNDCSWVSSDEIREAFKAASVRGVMITVRAAHVSAKDSETLSGCGVRLEELRARGQPFALVDDRILYLPVKTGSLRSEYSGMCTSNPYLVGNFLSLFENLSSSRRRTGK